ncbi:MAG: PIN domain-containing protein [Ruminococcus sp.]|nr:PIN domain-containing protein [Ruminococcus sp.]
MVIYLIDYENVYIDGLTGLEKLSKSDEVIIFYTQNRCGLTFELHRRLISCQATLQLMEVMAISTRKNTVKNALDLQLSMYIGYLVGRRPQVPLYIISKDTDFDLDLTFFEQYLQESHTTLAICSSIENALNGVEQLNTSRILKQAESESEMETETASNTEATPSRKERSAPKGKKNGSVVLFPKELQTSVRELLALDDQKVVNRICAIVTASEDLLTLNNLLSRYYHDGKQVKNIYHKLKPAFASLRENAVPQK